MYSIGRRVPFHVHKNQTQTIAPTPKLLSFKFDLIREEQPVEKSTSITGNTITTKGGNWCSRANLTSSTPLNPNPKTFKDVVSWKLKVVNIGMAAKHSLFKRPLDGSSAV